MMIGRNYQQAVVTIAERKSRLALFARETRKMAAQVCDATIDLLKPFEDKVKTLTFDNGKEFAGHIAIAGEIKADFYFAHPYASWERGLNENANVLLRQYFPKKTDFTKISDEDVKAVMNKLNNRSRKILGFKTPNEIFFGIKPFVAFAS